MSNYVVRQGDCISSIAKRTGHFWNKIWTDPHNAELKARRKSANILYPRDVVFIPEREEKQEPGATDQRHRFRKKGEPAKLRLRLLANDQPRGNESYLLDIDGRLLSGTTDSEGRLEHFIPPDAKKGKLMIGENQDEYRLDLGYIDPIDELPGIQARLKNLGFDCGNVDGVLGAMTIAALKRFQSKHGLEETGEPDQQTRDQLRAEHGS